MANGLATRQAAPTSAGYSREKAINAVKDFYLLLVRLPYVDPEALILPPLTGWPGVDVSELRNRGKTEEVIELLRHLPYLKQQPGAEWRIASDTFSIAYYVGSMYQAYVEDLQPIPGHAIWLTQGVDRGGHHLILDTTTGSVTAWAMSDPHLGVEQEIYDAMENTDKWMAHPTMPVESFFAQWRLRYEKLVWMFSPLSKASPGTGRFYCRANSREEEEDMLVSDDDWLPDGEEEDSTDGSEDDVLDDDLEELSGDELSGLEDNKESTLPDPDDQSTSELGEELESVNMNDDNSNEVKTRDDEGLDLDNPDYLTIKEARRAQEVYKIHIDNGWPSGFDRQKCRTDLLSFEERRAEEDDKMFREMGGDSDFDDEEEEEQT